MTDAREWSGDKARQHELANAICSICDGEQALDAAGACSTVLATLIRALSPTLADAEKGVDAIAADMKAALRRRHGH